MNKLTHLGEDGAARMVDVSAKDSTDRTATAEASIAMSEDAYAAVKDGHAPKGDVLAAARIAGIMAAKKTSELIPLCHPLTLTKAEVAFEMFDDVHTIRIETTVKTTGQTGVEMEALTAASVAALTIYDMIKALDRQASIGGIRLLAKSGGKSGSFDAAPSRMTTPVLGANKPPPAKRPIRASVLMDEAVARPQAKKSTESERDVFRAFMASRRLRATEWAKEAGVSSSEIYAFLTGRARSISTEAAERLARAAKVRVEDMFR